MFVIRKCSLLKDFRIGIKNGKCPKIFESKKLLASIAIQLDVRSLWHIRNFWDSV